MAEAAIAADVSIRRSFTRLTSRVERQPISTRPGKTASPQPYQVVEPRADDGRKGRVDRPIRLPRSRQRGSGKERAD